MEFIKSQRKQYKANLHCHSNLSDGKLSPAELKKLYKNNSYSILAITDHEYPFDHSKLSDPDFIMLTGYEAYIRPSKDCIYNIYTPEIHINLIAKEPHNVTYINFVPNCCKYIKDEEYKNSLPKYGSSETRRYTPEYVNSFVENANSAGYLAAHNHPVWSLEPHENISKYSGFFSMEMCNYGAHNSSEIEYNGALYERLLREGKRIFCHGSDDNHNHHPHDTPRTDSFGAFTVIYPDEFNYKSIISALEKGDFYSSMAPMIKELKVDGDHAYIKTSPAKKIIMHYGSKTPKCAFANTGELIEEAQFEIPKDASYVRFSVVDELRRYADTRGYFRDEFDTV